MPGDYNGRSVDDIWEKWHSLVSTRLLAISKITAFLWCRWSQNMWNKEYPIQYANSSLWFVLLWLYYLPVQWLHTIYLLILLRVASLAWKQVYYCPGDMGEMNLAWTKYNTIHLYTNFTHNTQGVLCEYVISYLPVWNPITKSDSTTEPPKYRTDLHECLWGRCTLNLFLELQQQYYQNAIHTLSLIRNNVVSQNNHGLYSATMFPMTHQTFYGI